jgi:ubiquinone/menaquinone biosynthesis C-methylase UbiE
MPSDPSRYQRIAPYYDLLDLPFERGRYRRIRPLLFQGLTGRLLDAGVGTGRNIPYYPPGTHVLGIDNSPAMLARAERRRRQYGAPVELREMDVTRLDLADASFDAAVATFLFCVLPRSQQAAALGELRRVVRPGGRIRLLEYVRPQGWLRNCLARLWEPWMAWAYGAGFDRNTEAYIPASGLERIGSHDVVPDLLRFVELRVPQAPGATAPRQDGGGA